MDFSGQVALVTGAAGNVGAAIADELAARGARLALADADAAGLSAVAARLPATAAALQLPGLDLRREDDAQHAVAAAVERFGQIDVLANTVGSFRMGRIDGDAVEQWRVLIELNAFSALVLCKAAGPAMARRRYGRMLHVAAGAAVRGGEEMSAYSASKAALVRIVEAAAEEFRSAGVTANCIAPSTIDTPQNRAAMPGADTSQWIAPSEIARAAAALLSPEAGAVTGAFIPLSKVG